MSKIFKVLTIAGSDSSAGAGIQADIKTISACGCYAATVITAITAQNTRGVYDVTAVSTDMIKAQMKAVFDDFKIDAIKIGMLLNADIINTVANELLELKTTPHIVLDPVMVSTSGDKLLENRALDILKKKLIPLATIITPNTQEANKLLNNKALDIKNIKKMEKYCTQIAKKYGVNTVLKGGHTNDEKSCLDVLCMHETLKTTSVITPKIKTKNIHGTGCALSSALACYLAKGNDTNEVFKLANQYVQKAINTGKNANWKGNGPINHFFEET